MQDFHRVEKSHTLMAQASWWQEISGLSASIEQKALSSIITCSIARNDVEAGSRLSFDGPSCGKSPAGTWFPARHCGLRVPPGPEAACPSGCTINH